MLVRQSAETWLGRGGTPIEPVPVGADALWLSSLGAWLDLHGAWTTKPYSAVQMQSILSWDHVAPMGRDQYVRVVYPGYLYPFGHQAALVKLTERKMKTAHQLGGRLVPADVPRHRPTVPAVRRVRLPVHRRPASGPW